MYDLAWIGSFLVRPGRSNYFIIFKYDEERIFKTDVKFDVPLRPLAMHHHILPKTKIEIDRKKRATTKKEDNYYFNIFN